MIELIIVIAIIVILAAIAIPTFTGFVDTANEAAAIAEARNVYLAAKVEMIEAEVNDYELDSETLAASAEGEANVDSGSVTDVVYVPGMGTFNFTYTSSNGVTIQAIDGEFTPVEMSSAVRDSDE